MSHLHFARWIARSSAALTALLPALGPMDATAGRHAALSNIITVDTRAADAPIFLAPPTDQTVVAGGEANFTVTTDGFPPLRYQWLKDGRALAAGSRVAGTDGLRLTLSNVNATDAGYYSVVVTNQYGAATSLVVRLTVTVGAYPTLAGFWPALAGSNVYAVLVNGNLASIAAGEAGLVLADVSNPAAPVWLGQYDTPGSVRSVCVAGAYAYLADGPGGLVILDVSHPASPVLVSQLAIGGTATGVRVEGSLAFIAAGEAGLVVVNVADPAHPSLTGACATGGGALNVFVKDNYAFVADGTNGLVVVNIGNPALPARVGGYPAAGAGVYDVAVVQDNAYLAGGSHGVVALDVRNPEAPARVGGLAGAGEAMGLQVLGSYVYVANGQGGLTVLDFATPSAPVWVGGFVTGGEVRGVALAQNYALVADRDYGLGVIKLDASEGSLAEILRPPSDAVAVRGQTAVLRVTARGTGALEFQWHKDGTPLTNSARVTGAATAQLTLSGILPGDAGHYAVLIANPAGTVTSAAAVLQVIWPSVITEQPQSLCVTEGSDARFQAAAGGDPPLVYQWWFNGAILPGETAPALLLSAVYHQQAGAYMLVVSNAYGRATSEVANLTVLSSPWIIRQPTNPVAPAGATVVLEVEAGGTAPLFYQWRRDGLDLTNGGRISGTTNALLVISGAQTNDSGLYSLVVANALGIVTNEPFNFAVYNGVGTASGLVRDGMTRAPMTNVSVHVSDAAGRPVASVVTDAQGAFRLSLEAGSYRLDFTRNGYVPTFALATLETGQNRQLETVLLAVDRPGTGVASGVVVNALTGEPLSGVLLQFRAGSGVADGPVLASTYSSALGTYQVTLPGGTYAADVSADGYISARVTVVVVGGQTLNNQGMTITPLLSDEALRIVLTWGKLPYDLDSHLIGPTASGEPFHISYYGIGATNEPPYAYLDVDDIFSYGPETITVTEFVPGTYVYSVHDFSDYLTSTNMLLSAISDARVRVFQGSFEVATFNVPMGRAGLVWTVFQFEGQNKQIVPINQFSSVDTEEIKDLRWFSWSTTSTGARQGWAWVTVTRLGGAEASASVDFSTHDGTARANTDYTPTTGTLDFAPGESSRQIKIPVADGPAAWGKAFTVWLSNPSAGWQLADSSVVSITVEEPPRLAPAITGSPTNLTVFAGGEAVFVASATGSEPLAWQWYRHADGVDLALAAATNANLRLTDVQRAAAGPYWAVVSNTLGRATSAVAVLTVSTARPVVAVGQPALSNGWFQIVLSSLPASGACVIWASSDLKLWTPVHTNPLPAAPYQFAEPVLPNRPVRFYRASILP